MLTKGLQVPVYTQEKTTDTFIYTTGMSALDEFSICFWMNGVEDDDHWKSDALISIATSGKLTEQSKVICHKHALVRLSTTIRMFEDIFRHRYWLQEWK